LLIWCLLIVGCGGGVRKDPVPVVRTTRAGDAERNIVTLVQELR